MHKLMAMQSHNVENTVRIHGNTTKTDRQWCKHSQDIQLTSVEYNVNNNENNFKNMEIQQGHIEKHV